MNRDIVRLLLGGRMVGGDDRKCGSGGGCVQSAEWPRLSPNPVSGVEMGRCAAGGDEPVVGRCRGLPGDDHECGRSRRSCSQVFSRPLQPWGAWLGGFQPAGSAEPAGNWQWVTGEAFGYANWHPSGEPSNANNNENQLQLLNNGYWNDLGTSEPVGSPLYDLPYIVEFNVPEPASCWMALTAIYVAGGLPRRGRRGRG